MNYNDVFVIDKVTYNKINNINNNIEPYKLNNFNYYKPKLIDDFYLKYFTELLLFEIDILDVEDFLDFHYSNCENSKKLLKVLEFKIITKIDEIVLNANISMGDYGGVKTKDLDAGLKEDEEVIYHPLYEDSFFYHTTALNKLHSDLKKRKLIINEYISKVKSLNNKGNLEVLKWIGKPSHLAFIIRYLIEEGYIEEPKLSSNEINLTEASRRILNSFSFNSEQSINTIRIYLDVNSVKHKALKQNFDKEGFNIPNKGFLG